MSPIIYSRIHRSCQVKNWTFGFNYCINGDIFRKYTDMKNEDTGITRRDFLRSAATAGAAAVVASAVGIGEAEASAGQFRFIQPYDMKGVSQLDAVRAGAAEVSAGRVAIAAYGDDQRFIDAIERATLYYRKEGPFADRPGDAIPVDVVWADNTHSGGKNAIDVYVDGYRFLPGQNMPPFEIDSDANHVARAVQDSFNNWKSLAQAPGPTPPKG